MATFNVTIKGRMVFGGDHINSAVEAVNEFCAKYTEEGHTCQVKISVPQDIWNKERKERTAQRNVSKKAEAAEKRSLKQSSAPARTVRRPSKS